MHNIEVYVSTENFISDDDYKTVNDDEYSDVTTITIAPDKFTGRVIKKLESMGAFEETCVIVPELIENTDIETLTFFIKQLIKYTKQKEYDLEMHSYFSNALSSRDPRMWKFFLDNHTDKKLIQTNDSCNCDNSHISTCFDNSHNDEYIDKLIEIFTYLKPRITANTDRFNIVEKTIDQSNPKMLKYLLGIVTDNIENGIIDLRKDIIYAILKNKLDFAELLLGYHNVDNMVDNKEWFDYKTESNDDSWKQMFADNLRKTELDSVIFLHELYMNGKIEMSVKFVMYLIPYCMKFDLVHIFTYITTMFPLIAADTLEELNESDELAIILHGSDSGKPESYYVSYLEKLRRETKNIE